MIKRVNDNDKQAELRRIDTKFIQDLHFIKQRRVQDGLDDVDKPVSDRRLTKAIRNLPEWKPIIIPRLIKAELVEDRWQ